jgi:hypothetical protein
MSRIRFGLLSVLAVLAVSGVATSSAFAVEKECATKASGESEKGKDVALCIGTKEVTTLVPFSVTKKAATESKLEVTGGPTIVCESAEGKGEFDTTEPETHVSDIYLKFKGKCEVTNNVE